MSLYCGDTSLSKLSAAALCSPGATWEYVSRVTCIAFGASLNAWFRSNDHLPPHFHLEKAGLWEIRVFFRRSANTMIELVWGNGPRGKEQRAIVMDVEANRENLEKEWSQKVCVTEPGAEE